MFVKPGIYLPPEKFTPDYLGGKGYNLMKMVEKGVNVPPFIIIPTEVCRDYMECPFSVIQELKQEIGKALGFLSNKFGYAPLVSVRSGAKFSMPGMMDTILNVGLDEDTLPFWREKVSTPVCNELYERLITMYSDVVHKIPQSKFGGKKYKACLNLFKKEIGNDFPDARLQILEAIEAVFRSWSNERAVFYREMNGIPHDLGTAVVIQSMVFGNLDDQSGTGVMFSRNPDTGENKVTGEYLVRAQGEDIVAGVRTPQNLDSFQEDFSTELKDELLSTCKMLENMNGDVQDVEFTIQSGELFILQTRNAKRSSKAAVKIALDYYKEGGEEEAFFGVVNTDTLEKIKTPSVSPSYSQEENYSGVPACSGAVSGVPVYSVEEALMCEEPCILVAKETTPDDIKGMDKAVGILTMEGGYTCHAAVVARGMNKPCVVGVGVDIWDFRAEKPEVITIDGGTGKVWLTSVPLVGGEDDPLLKEVEEVLLDKYKDKYQKTVWNSNGVGGEGVVVSVSPYLMGGEEEFYSLVKDALDSGTETVYVDFTLEETPQYFMLKFMYSLEELRDMVAREVEGLLGHLTKDEAKRLKFVFSSSQGVTMAPNPIKSLKKVKMEEFLEEGAILLGSDYPNLDKLIIAGKSISKEIIIFGAEGGEGDDLRIVSKEQALSYMLN